MGEHVLAYKCLADWHVFDAELSNNMGACLTFSQKSFCHPHLLVCFVIRCRVPLLESVVEHGWCQLVPRLLTISEHDAREKVLNAMWTLREPCRAEFADHLSVLKRLHGEYTQLSEMEIRHNGSSADEPQYFTELLQTVDFMIRHVTLTKDELWCYSLAIRMGEHNILSLTYLMKCLADWHVFDAELSNNMGACLTFSQKSLCSAVLDGYSYLAIIFIVWCRVPNFCYHGNKGRSGVNFNDSIKFSNHDFLKSVGYFGIQKLFCEFIMWAIVKPEQARRLNRQSISSLVWKSTGLGYA